MKPLHCVIKQHSENEFSVYVKKTSVKLATLETLQKAKTFCEYHGMTYSICEEI